MFFLLCHLIFAVAFGQEAPSSQHVEIRRLTVSVDDQIDSVSDSGIYFEFERAGQKVVMNLLDNGEAPDVQLNDQRYSGIISVEGAGFSPVLMDGAGAIIWSDDTLQIPDDFELPALRIVVSESEVSGVIVDDINFLPEVDEVEEVVRRPVRRGELSKLAKTLGIVGLLCGVYMSILVTCRRRDPITFERRLELVEVDPNLDRVIQIVDLVAGITETGPVLLVTDNAGVMDVVSDAVGVLTLDIKRPTVKNLSRFISGTLMVQGRAVTVIDGADALAPLPSDEPEGSLLHEIERCVSGVVYFVS